MGVADNKSYKDQIPYFKDLYPVTSGNYPSLNVQKDIGSTIKENPYYSNVEIEGDETVLNPDMSAIFKAIGNKHSRGGMDVVLKPDSFVFSDDKSLAFDKHDHKLFELKEGGSFKPEKNTPSEVVRRNIKLKHYNTLVTNLKDPQKDYLAQISSGRMLEKYISKLGQIAYIQEAKKGLPDGIPHFAAGTAPVYSPEVKEDVMESKQYAKYGGVIDNPYRQLQGGGYLNKLNKNTGPQYSNNQGYMTLVNGMPTWVPAKMLPTAKAPNTNQQGKYSGVPPLSGVPPETELKIPIPNFPDILPPDTTRYTPSTTDTTTLKPGTVTGGPQGPVRADWNFTPWQKLSQLYNWGQYANAKRYMPYRSHYNATYVEPSLLNPEQTLNDARAISNQQISALTTLNPILRNAQAQAIYGQELSQLPQIRAQYDNYNTQITNQSRMYNNQLRNQETQTNLGYDQQYYQQAIEGRKNFDNLRQFLANNAMSEVLGDVATNQTLANQFLTYNNPAYRYDWNTGNLVRNKKDLRDVEESPQSDYIGSLLRTIDFQSLSNIDKIRFIRELQRGKALQYLNPYFSQQGQGFKKGGKVNPYEY